MSKERCRGSRRGGNDLFELDSLDHGFLQGPRPDYELVGPSVRIVDLFSGCGGLSIGCVEAARRVGRRADVRLAVDNEHDAVKVYQAIFPDASVWQEDISSLFDGIGNEPATANEQRTANACGRVDVLLGGPPCQGHSDLNNHTRRCDERNALYSKMARAAVVLRPKLVLIENVPTAKHDSSNVVGNTVSILKTAGYQVEERVLDLSFLGVPQRRRRHALLASRQRGVRPADVMDAVASHMMSATPLTVRWAINDLLPLYGSTPFDTASHPSPANQKRMEWLIAKEEYNLPNHLRPPCHRSEHTYNAMYGRLHWNAAAQTITTGFGSMGQGRYVHPECARSSCLDEHHRHSDWRPHLAIRSESKLGHLQRIPSRLCL